MTLTEVLPEVNSLSRLEKIRLIEFFALELDQNDSGLIDANRTYPIWSPDSVFKAADFLQQALANNLA